MRSRLGSLEVAYLGGRALHHPIDGPDDQGQLGDRLPSASVSGGQGTWQEKPKAQNPPLGAESPGQGQRPLPIRCTRCWARFTYT